MKNVISWKTISRMGVRFGSALSPACDPDINRFRSRRIQ
jgi:hypothetical protein